MPKHAIVAAFAALCLAACTSPPFKPSDAHVNSAAPRAGKIPAPLQQSAVAPKPQAVVKPETYSVVVNDVPVQELLFALARDAKLNIDIHSGLSGSVTLNAIDQTLPQLLERIAKQVGMRYEADGANLIILPDAPLMRTYRIDYVNVVRESSSTITVATQVFSAGATGSSQGQSGTAGGGAGGGSNNSTTQINNLHRNRFWDTLTQNITDLLKDGDQKTGAGAKPAPAVVSNPESGVISVFATARQHDKVQTFVDQVMVGARRQVLIEATVAEVTLSRDFQQGVDWSRLRTKPNGLEFRQRAVGPDNKATIDSSLVTLTYTNPGSALGSLSAAVSLLESFGTVKVLSSPKLSVLNNQTAVLKVVDNRVFFTIDSDVKQNQNQTIQTFTTTVSTVPVGLIVSVTPQISDTESVLINIRPTISRVFNERVDPNPALKAVGIENTIPEIRTREMESMLMVNSGDVAVMGGLMQDELNDGKDTVPGLANIPVIGNLFQHKTQSTVKSELVVFLRPQVIRDANVDGDYAQFRSRLPRDDFFTRVTGPGRGDDHQ
jgi:general secretion pathway protein D